MITENEIYNMDCLEGMAQMADGSVDCIVTDPPFLYLKNQKLEKPFDEERFFSEAFRILKKGGIIAFFGRGVSFYRWNTICERLGFKFLEEVIWDKGRTTSPVLPLGRVHETIAIYGKEGKIIRRKVPYIEKRQYELDRVIMDINRLMPVLSNPKELDVVKQYLSTHIKEFENSPRITKYKTSIQGTNSCSRAVNVLASMHEGLLETSIIKERKNSYKAIHPTEKPVRLMERIIALVSEEGDIVLDPFSGSASTSVAAKNTGRRYIGFEIDEEYYNDSVKRLCQILI